MLRTLLRSKIHRATVTGASVDYVGSISVCPRLLEAADIIVGEQVDVVDVTNGARLTTYAIEGEEGEVCLNGAAARLVTPGDVVIIINYAQFEPAEIADHEPRVVHVDSFNRAVPEDLAKELAASRRYVEVV